MNTASFNIVFKVFGILNGLLLAMMLMVVWIGWLRQRRVGFLVLVAWALVALFGMLGEWLSFPYAHDLLRKLFPSPATDVLTVLPLVLSSLVSSALLLAGLALLVFGDSWAAGSGSRTGRDGEN